MASGRKRSVKVPSMGQIMNESKSKTGTAYEREVLSGAVVKNGASTGVDAKGVSTTAPGLAARERARRAMTYDTAMAIQASKQGDDSELLPYQPTPSINPPRPRTLAAGYDPEARVMRVRFRDGAGYEYYDVTPTEWRNFKRVKSPGRSINKNFKYSQHPYARADW